MPKRKRKVSSGGKKTTTKDGKREYQKNYMRLYREQQRKKLERLQKQFPSVYELFFGKEKGTK